ncbi:MAG: SRPBCC family protein [Burkholderiales bacterium]|nr:SRPBCC family protein [Burkholderiales bacterium]
MMKKVLLVLAGLAAAFSATVALQPGDFRVTRATTITASAAQAYDNVHNFRNWEPWSPWVDLDPAASIGFAGPPEGTGMVMTWAGNDKVGEGRMTIAESRPYELVRITVEFAKPFEAMLTWEFTFRSAGEKTEVTWSAYGRYGFLARAIGVFTDTEKALGADLERGLARLKVLTEGPGTR